MTIGEVADVIGGGTPSTKVPENFDGEIPWITPKDLAQHEAREIHHGSRNITNAGLASSSARMLPRQAVLLSTRAPIGYVAIAGRSVSTNQGFRSLVMKDGNVPEFFYYLLKANKAVLESRAGGSTFREISGTSLKETEFSVPSPEEQGRIARVLGALDDKIESNRRLAQTLEGIAATLFRSRFVDFTGDDDLAGGKLEAPRGWQICSIADIATIRRDLIDPAEEPEQVLEHFSFPAFDAGRAQAITTGAALKSAKYLVDERCVLVSKLNPARQRVWWPVPDGHGKSVCSTEFVVLEPKADIPHAFLYAVARFHPGVHRHIVAHATGTTGSRQRARPQDVIDAKLVMPPAESLTELAEPLAPLFVAAEHAHRESRIYRAIRDRLLPRLVSGDLPVPADPEPA